MSLTDSPASGSIRIHGGTGAPGRARCNVSERLEGRVDAATASVAALIVSELVTNSVMHANAGRDQAVVLELTRLDDRLRVAVTDPGSQSEPHLVPVDPTTPRGFGLRLVEDLSCAWGVLRHGRGMTYVWCELRLDPGVCS